MSSSHDNRKNCYTNIESKANYASFASAHCERLHDPFINRAEPARTTINSSSGGQKRETFFLCFLSQRAERCFQVGEVGQMMDKF